MKTALIIVHLVISLILIVIVLLQQGKQAGLSGAVAGGAETFFGKNKGRTIDAMLRKVTAAAAILFIASSLVLAYVATKSENGAADTATQQVQLDGQTIEVGGGETEATEGEATQSEAPETEAADTEAAGE